MQKYKIGHFSILFAAVTAILLSAASCNSPRDLSITSCSVSSLNYAEGGVDVLLDVRMDNPAHKMKMSDISGEVFVKDSSLGTFTIDDFTVEARSEKDYYIPIHCSVSKAKLLGIMIGGVKLKAEDITLDVQADCKYLGVKKKFSREGIVLKNYLKKL